MVFIEDDNSAAWHHHEELLRQRYEVEHQSFHSPKEKTMGLIAKDNSEGGKYEAAPAGAYVARCFRVIDLGTQTWSYNGETKRAHQVLINWELSKKMDDGKPFTIGEKYTVSLNEKANLSKMLEGWRGRKFTDAERAGFDLKNVLGKVCLLNIVHVSRNGKTYANVASAMPVPEGLPSPEPVNELRFYSIEAGQVPDYIPKFAKDLILKSPEYQMANSSQSGGSSGVGSDFDDDDIPF